MTVRSATALIQDRKTLVGAVIILLLWTLTVIAVNPIHNFPIEDDWDYSRMVKNFVDTGRVQRSDYAQATLIFPTLYGGAFSKLFGFSFTNLRLSTLLLALGTLLAFYALLGELEFDFPRRLVGTLALLFTPIFIYLAFSFMTDVPTLFWLTLSVWFYVRAFKRDRLRDAFLGSLCAALAFLTRQTGIFPPLAFGAIVLFRLPRAVWLKQFAAGVLPAAVVIGLYFALNPEGTGNWATSNVTFGWTLERVIQPEWWGIYLRRGVQTLLTVSFYLAPLFAALVFARPMRMPGLPEWTRSNRLRVVMIGAVALFIAATIVRLAARDEWFPYLTDIFTRAGMRPYLAFIAWDAQALRPDFLPLWFFVGLTLLAAVLGVALLIILAARVHRDALTRTPPEYQFTWVLTLVLAVVTCLFATFYERYLLPLFLGAIILLLDTSRRIGFSWRAGAVGLVLFALPIWLLMQDYWSWNELRWQVGHELVAQGIPAEKIDAGYEWGGQYLYDATVEYITKTGKPFTLDPWQYVLDPEYALAFRPIDHYRIVQTYEFVTPLANHQFYLLHRE